MSTATTSAKSIFLQAVELSTAGERQAYLDTQCGADADLRRDVDALLQYHGEVGSFLESPPTVVAQSAEQLRTDVPQSPTLGFLQPSSRSDSLGRLGRHEVLEVVGSGGMGVVLKAFDEQLQRVVAIKALADSLASNEHARRRFVREGRAAAAIRDDHVIGIYGVDETNGLPFLVMEYVVGRSLAQRLEADGPLPLADILRIGSQIARGLAAAHAQGLVHRDIKPANILLENGVERVKITDFGLAHAVDDVRTTQPGTVIGTPEYMSPEQARGERVDHRSDLFSLGCVLYAMCAGRPPFRADSTIAILRRICEDTPKPLTEINADIPDWLADVIDKLIAKDASERFQSAAEVAELLGQYLAHVQQPAVNPQPVGWDKLRAPTRSVGRRAPAHHSPAPSSRDSAFRTPRSALNYSLTAAILLLAAVLVASESTGVTNVAATVIRIVRGDGTLVVEIDDPNIQVLLDGEELVITGAGPKELRLRPGQHELQTVKPGKPSDTKLITITRDGRQVVKVAREASPAAVSASPIARLVWADAVDMDGSVSPDGRYLAFVDWETGDLAVRDLATGKNRRLTNKGTWSESNAFALGAKFSPDGTQLAYTWYDKGGPGPANSRMFGELRVIGVEGGDPRVVYSNPGNGELVVGGWTPDGKAILAKLRLAGEPRNSDATEPAKQRPVQFALIATSDGSLRVIKSLESPRGPVGVFRVTPDGRTIAFSRISEPASATRDIFLMDVETGQEIRVTTHAAAKSILDWTPDGQHLLFDMERQGARDAWMIRVAGGKPQGEAELVKKDLGAIVPHGFTRDGTFYYSSSSHGQSLFTATLDLEKATAIATPLAAEKFNILDRLTLGDWSPDGEQLAYWARSQQSGEMRIVSMKTGQTRVLKPTVNIWRSFRWSPDGRSLIAATGAAAGQKPGIYQIDAISGQATTVFEPRGGGQCVWSPDGRGIFYVRTGADGTFTIVSRDLQAQTEKEVLTRGNPAFAPRFDFWFNPSPDGRQIALLGEPNGDSMALWLVPLDGGASRELLKVNTPGTFAGGVGWTPDGRFVLFIQLGGDESQRGLWYISANGGQPRKVALSGVEAKNVTRLAIHPDGKQLALDVRGTGKSEVWALENFLPPLKDSAAATIADASAAKSKSAAAAESATAGQQPSPATPTTRLVWDNATAEAESSSISPDGRYLAFVNWGNGDLTLRDLVTGKNRGLTNKGSWDESGEFAMLPRFSGNGKRLAFTWYNMERRTELRVISVDGGEPQVFHIDANDKEAYGWTPDGRSILAGLYTKRDATLQLTLIDVTDGSLRPIKSLEWHRGKVSRFSLAPDGRTIAYSRVVEPGSANRDIFLIDVASGQETRATSHVADTDVLGWVPDGQRLLVTIQRQGTWDAWTIRTPDGKPQGEPQLVKADLGTVTPLGFTRDGAFYYGLRYGGPNLYTAALDLEKGAATATPLPGERLSIMDQLFQPTWSPDGRYLAYKANRPNQIQEIRILPTEGGPVRVLQPDFVFLNSFRWAPDGQSFVSVAQKKPGQLGIYQIDARTGNTTAIVEPAEKAILAAISPRWSPDGRGIFYINRFGIVYRDIQAQTERKTSIPGDSVLANPIFDVSPDGRQLAVLGKEVNTDALVLRLIPVDGGASRDLLRVNERAQRGWVSWTPDGKYVLFTRYGADEKDGALEYISANGGKPRKFVLSGLEGKAVQHIAVHPDGRQLAFTVLGSRKSEIWALENFLPLLKDSDPAAAADPSAAKSR